MDKLINVLRRFTPITLDQMDHVQLLDRIDTKYILTQQQLAELLGEIADAYSILTIRDQFFHAYETVYFDTAAHDLYLMHHNGRRNRYKLRFRKYLDSGISFFEVKQKTNTRRTIKSRIRVTGITDVLTAKQQQFVHECIHEDTPDFFPALQVKFTRITLVNHQGGERITIDTNLHYLNDGREKEIDRIAIVEVKQQKHSESPFRKLMRDNRLHEFYLSKYCLGITCLNENLKKNRFKRKLMALNKLGYDVY